MTLVEIFAILLCHWVFDFVCQTHNQAINKSESWLYLLGHTYRYSIYWMLPGAIYAMYLGDDYPKWHATYFCLITFFFHTLTDYFTSRLNKYLWFKGNMHNFFVGIGFDQLLHYVQLYLTFYLLFK